jgi:hypothetical protein
MKKKLPNAARADKPRIRLGKRHRAVVLRELAETLDEKLIQVQRSTDSSDHVWDARYHFETPALDRLKGSKVPK